MSQSPTQTNERFPTRRPKTHTASIGFVIGQNIRDGAKPPHVPLPSLWRDLPACISGPALRIYLQHFSLNLNEVADPYAQEKEADS